MERKQCMQSSIYCPHCHKHTALSVAPAEYQDQYAEKQHTPAIWHANNGNWWIGICNACRQPCLVLDDAQIVYPTPLPAPTDKHVPTAIAKDLDEAKMSFSVGCYRACAVMARRCLQAACLIKGAAEGDLVKQIKELTQKGVITADIEEWATVLRWVGNDAAHPGGDQVVKEDAEDCLKLAEQFLHVVFVASAVAKARRSARGK